MGINLNIDFNLVQKLLKEIIHKEKQFLYDRSLSEQKKVKELKKLIEKEVSLNDN